MALSPQAKSSEHNPLTAVVFAKKCFPASLKIGFVQSVFVAVLLDKYCLLLAEKLTVRMLWMNYQTRLSMQVLRFPAVSRVTGLPQSTLYLYMKNDQFPKPIKLGMRSVGWIKEEIDEWLQKRKNSRNL